MLKGWFKKYWGLLLVTFISFWAVKPLIQEGFFPMHDDTQVARVFEMKNALLDGQFPVRWVSDLGYGYGYPIFNFYSPLPYYISALFAIFGFDALTATKLMFGVGILLSAIFMFLLGKRLFGNLGGLICSILYQYAPYHAIDVYIRGAVGEFYAIGFLPLFFLGFVGVLEKSIFSPWTEDEKIWKDSLIAGIGLAGVILSHNITAMLLAFILAPTLTLTLVILKLTNILRSKVQIITLARSTLSLILVGLTLSAFFWLPALTEMQYTDIVSTIGGGADYRDHFLYIDQLWDSAWGYAGSAPGRADGVSFKIGKIHILAGLIGISIAFAMIAKKKEKKYAIPLLLFSALLLLSVFMTLQQSQIIWQLFGFLAYAQYPWRFMVFIIFALSIMAGFMVLSSSVIGQKVRFLSTAIIVLIGLFVIFFNAKYFKPQMITQALVDDYTDVSNIRWKISKISDEYLPRNFNKPQNSNEVVENKLTSNLPIQIIREKVSSQRYLFDVNVPYSTEFTINTAYFPGWRIYIDDIPVAFTTENNLMHATITSGYHTIKVELQNTPVRTFANTITILSLFLIAGKILPIRNILTRL